MTRNQIYDVFADEKLKFAAIVAKYQGQWVFCKHKERDTHETAGCHRKPNETILEMARREFFEETGVVEFNIVRVCVYEVIESGFTSM